MKRVDSHGNQILQKKRKKTETKRKKKNRKEKNAIKLDIAVFKFYTNKRKRKMERIEFGIAIRKLFAKEKNVTSSNQRTVTAVCARNLAVYADRRELTSPCDASDSLNGILVITVLENYKTVDIHKNVFRYKRTETNITVPSSVVVSHRKLTAPLGLKSTRSHLSDGLTSVAALEAGPFSGTTSHLFATCQTVIGRRLRGIGSHFRAGFCAACKRGRV